MEEDVTESSFGWKLAYVVGLSSIAFLGGVRVGVAGATRSRAHDVEEDHHHSSRSMPVESPTRIARRALVWATLINMGCMILVVKGMKMAAGCDTVSIYCMLFVCLLWKLGVQGKNYFYERVSLHSLDNTMSCCGCYNTTSVSVSRTAFLLWCLIDCYTQPLL